MDSCSVDTIDCGAKDYFEWVVERRRRRLLEFVVDMVVWLQAREQDRLR